VAACLAIRRVCQGVVEFFVYFGLSLLAVQPILLALRYSFADYVRAAIRTDALSIRNAKALRSLSCFQVPKLVLVALSHSVSPTVVIRRVIARR
jgi:hypothetical protein